MTHWHTTPELDFRTYLPLERRGRLNTGHRGRDATKCPACTQPVAVTKPTKHLPRRKKVAYFLLPEEVTLRAAEQVSQNGKGVVNLSELLVAVWKLSPNLFGLPGYKDQYPDSNKLLNCIDVAQCKDWLRLKESHTWTIGAGGWRRLHELSRLNTRMPK